MLLAGAQAVKVVVCGSRSFRSEEVFYQRMGALWLEARDRGEQMTLVFGDARGPDAWAKVFAEAYKLDFEVYVADWKVTDETPKSRVRVRSDGVKYDVAGGMIRNVRMLDENLDADLCLAFYSGASRGTGKMIDMSKRRKIPVEVVRPDAVVEYHARRRERSTP